MEVARHQIEAWKSEAADQTVVSASAVQDKLFDLWGELRDYAVVSQVEQWLSLTVQRELFSGKELIEFLDELDRSLTDEVSV